MNPARERLLGQSLVETVLLLPLLLVLLAGGYWSYRYLSLSGAAESAAQTHLLREGRRMPGIQDLLSRTIHPEEGAVRFGSGNSPPVGQVPLFPGMVGRTGVSAEVSCPNEPVGAYLSVPPHRIRREAEGAVDCWERSTPSGRKVRRTVTGIVAAGVLR